FTVNLDKYRQMYRIYRSATKDWVRTPLNTTNVEDWSIANPALQDYMAILAARDNDFDPARYFTASLACEPGQDRRYYDLKRAPHKIRTVGAHGPLVFAELLPDHPLLYLSSVSPRLVVAA